MSGKDNTYCLFMENIMVMTINPDPIRLDSILQGIHEQGGKTTLAKDFHWLQLVQHSKPMPEWAKNIFDKWASQPHVLSEKIKRSVI